MVQFQVNKEEPEENSCGLCKSYNEGFCYKWSFPIREEHIPCTKFRKQENHQDFDENETSKLAKIELIREFFNRLNTFKEDIIGKPYDEIYIALDKLMEEYSDKFNFEI
ncbi:MAG: hypothetical protein ACFFAH_01940 [Promethearchaeota archaeon]